MRKRPELNPPPPKVSLVKFIRAFPVPSTLAALGIGWLIGAAPPGLQKLNELLDILNAPPGAPPVPPPDENKSK